MGKSNSKEKFDVNKNSQFTSKSSGVYRTFDQFNEWTAAKNGKHRAEPKNHQDNERVLPPVIPKTEDKRLDIFNTSKNESNADRTYRSDASIMGIPISNNDQMRESVSNDEELEGATKEIIDEINKLATPPNSLEEEIENPSHCLVENENSQIVTMQTTDKNDEQPDGIISSRVELKQNDMTNISTIREEVLDVKVNNTVQDCDIKNSEVVSEEVEENQNQIFRNSEHAEIDDHHLLKEENGKQEKIIEHQVTFQVIPAEENKDLELFTTHDRQLTKNDNSESEKHQEYHETILQSISTEKNNEYNNIETKYETDGYQSTNREMDTHHHSLIDEVFESKGIIEHHKIISQIVSVNETEKVQTITEHHETISCIKPMDENNTNKDHVISIENTKIVMTETNNEDQIEHYKVELEIKLEKDSKEHLEEDEEIEVVKELEAITAANLDYIEIEPVTLVQIKTEDSKILNDIKQTEDIERKHNDIKKEQEENTSSTVKEEQQNISDNTTDTKTEEQTAGVDVDKKDKEPEVHDFDKSSEKKSEVNVPIRTPDLHQN